MRFFVSFLAGMALLMAITVTSFKKEVVKAVRAAPAPNAAGDREKTVILRWMSRCNGISLDVAERIYAEAHKHRFPDLLIAIAKVESNFNPDAISDKGALGLMQIMGGTWTEELRQQGIIRGEADLFNISKCMDASSYILDKYIEWKRGNLEDALLEYSGPADHSYPKKIMAALDEMEAAKERD